MIRKFWDSDKNDLTVSKSELARRIRHKYPQLFDTENAARNAVRYYTGSNGDQTRRGSADKSFYSQSSIQEGLKKAGVYSLHKSLDSPVVLPPGKYGVLQDIHVPFQHDQALSAALAKLKEEKIDGLVLNGDIVDCYQVSSYTKETDRPSLLEEMRMTYVFLRNLRKMFPKIPIWYKFGNHEERMRQYILKNAMQLAEFPELSIEGMLHFDELGIKKVGREVIKAGDFNILHGHELGRSVFSPVNVARGLFTRINASGGVGHHHQRSMHRQNTLDGGMIVTHSFACLCHLDPEYMPYGSLKWAHGFGVVEVLNGIGHFTVTNYEIINGEIFT